MRTWEPRAVRISEEEGVCMRGFGVLAAVLMKIPIL